MRSAKKLRKSRFLLFFCIFAKIKTNQQTNMKKKILILMGLTFVASGLFAQNYKTFQTNNAKNAGNGIYYSVPQTEIVVKVKVEKTSRTKGIYSDKAYLLGIDNALLKNANTYQIKDISISSRAVPSASKYFLTYTDKTSVDVSPNGVLRSITASGEKQEAKHSKQRKEQTTQIQQVQSPVAMPTFEQKLISQGLLTSYPLMSAEKVVAEIKNLRQKQVDILSGGMEGTYLNTTIDFMYKQLDEIINGYLALFVGVTTTSEEEYVFNIVPEKPIIVEEDLLLPVFKFSKENGVSDLSTRNEDAKVMARIHSFNTTASMAEQMNTQTSSKEFKAKASKGLGVYYAVPEQVKVSMEYQNNVLASQVMQLAQYGTIGVLLEGNNNVTFDEKTGALLKIWK